MKQEVISSSKNPLIKRVLGFEKKRNRDFQHKFVVEGIRENRMALANGWLHEEIILPESQDGNWLQSNGFDTSALHVQYISNALFEKLAYRGRVANMIGIYHTRDHSPKNLKLPDRPLVLVLESLEKPGNIGAIMRTADAAGVDALILADPVADLYNPNLIRGSLGTVFSLNTAIGTNREVLDLIHRHQWRICTTSLEGANPHYNADLTGGLCIVMGSEAHGVTDFWINNADEIVKIPMHGKVDSLNVSTATAILLFEARRQREKEN